MTQMIEVYRSASSATPAPPVVDLSQERPTELAVMYVVTSPHRPDPYVSDELAAEIREALAAADRGETEDLGSFAQYADEPDDED